MKKIIKLLFLLILVIPIIVSAGTYKNEIKNANDLIKQDFYKNTYKQYMLHGKKIKYEYSNNKIKYNSQFINGGFISMDEYMLTKVNGLSYLHSENGYWTLTEKQNKLFVVSKDNTDAFKNSNSTYSSRVTEYVNQKAIVSGDGTQNNPWQFDPMYKVSVAVNTDNAVIVSGNDEYVKGNCSKEECVAKIKITGKNGYRYISNDCNGEYDIKTNILSIKNVKRNLQCNVSFEFGLFTISIKDAQPEIFYAIYGDNYYSNVDSKNVLKELKSISSKKGYSFIGIKYEGNEVVNKNKVLNRNFLDIITKDLILEPMYEAKKYNVIYNCNGGISSIKNDNVTFGGPFTLTSELCKREGYVQIGWNLQKDGKGISWTKKDKTNWTWNIDSNVILYAVWQKCNSGTYSGLDDNVCISCKAGSYSDTGSKKCNKCPEGYKSAAGSTSIDMCYINVEAGKYINKSNKIRECPNGTYSNEQIVYYGKASTCQNCPIGYADGTELSDKLDESACLRNVLAGYFVETEKAPGNSVCENGYYKENHKVRYGETSSCEICPTGYRDGSKLENKVSLDKCTRNVTAGYYIASSKSINNTMCPNGQYSKMHSINYGETSKCSQCPSGYQDGRKLENKVSKESCIKNVNAGNFVESSKDENSKVCSNGFYKESHQINYGETSKCEICPEGYRDGATVSNKSSKNKCLKNVSSGYYIAKTNDSVSSVCPDGYYKEKHSVTYGEVSVCSLCPEGYRDAKGNSRKSSIDECTRIVAGGYYVAKEKDKNNTLCPNGKYISTHIVTYGKTSTCNNCPDGYRDGTTLESKTSVDKCVRNVKAGYYVMGSKSTNDTECPTGYYNTAHSINYGQTSRCSVCPSGYRNGVNVNNKVSESSCIRNVPQNFYVANSKEDKNTACPQGKTKSSHIVKYGQISSCN